MSIDFGASDGQFQFYAVMTPDGRIPTVDDESNLNEPAGWYTGPFVSLAHLSHYALIFSEWEDAHADFHLHRDRLPVGTRIRAFRVAVDEVENAYEGLEDQAV